MFDQLLSCLQSQNINWIGIARDAGLPRAMFSKAFNGHQPISEKNYVRIFHAILEVTGALVFDGRIWTKDDTGTTFWMSSADWDDANKRGLMDAHDLRVYLGG